MVKVFEAGQHIISHLGICSISETTFLMDILSCRVMRVMILLLNSFFYKIIPSPDTSFK